MDKSMKKVLLLVLAVISIMAGALIVASDRNITEIFPLGGSMIDQCEVLDDGGKIRLYEGGSSITTPTWYSVTFQDSFFAMERPFFGSYAYPLVSNVECSTGSVVIYDMSGAVLLSATVDHIQKELVNESVVFDYGLRRQGNPSIAFGLPLECSTSCAACLSLL